MVVVEGVLVVVAMVVLEVVMVVGGGLVGLTVEVVVVVELEVVTSRALQKAVGVLRDDAGGHRAVITGRSPR